MGHMGNHWDEQQNEQRGNQYRKVMPAPFRDAEPGENPARAKIDFHVLGLPTGSRIVAALGLFLAIRIVVIGIPHSVRNEEKNYFFFGTSFSSSAAKIFLIWLRAWMDHGPMVSRRV